VGYLAKVAVPPTKKKKLGSKTIDFVFIGYTQHSVAYRFLVINSEVNGIDSNTIIESRVATFFESFL